MKALVVHPGTQYSFRLARQLHRHGCLRRFWTGFAYTPESTLGRCLELLPSQYKNSLANRCLEGVSAERLRTRPLIEWRALRQQRTGCDYQQVMLDRNAAFQREIGRASCRERV